MFVFGGRIQVVCLTCGVTGLEYVYSYMVDLVAAVGCEVLFSITTLWYYQLHHVCLKYCHSSYEDSLPLSNTVPAHTDLMV